MGKVQLGDRSWVRIPGAPDNNLRRVGIYPEKGGRSRNCGAYYGKLDAWVQWAQGVVFFPPFFPPRSHSEMTIAINI